MRVAIIHYWLVGMRGGEKVIEALLDLFPDADIYTHVHAPSQVSERINSRVVGTTFIGRLPFAEQLYQSYLPLMPRALEGLDLRGYDLILSSESGPAKGIIPPDDALHICYCHTPMRYLWSMHKAYVHEAGWLKGAVLSAAAHHLRIWDVSSAARVDHFIANSSTVAERIRRYYRRDATVIHPPVDVDAITPTNIPGDYYLVAGELVGYKRADLAVEAFNRSGKPLIVMGGGAQEAELRRRAGPNVQVIGRQSDTEWRRILSGCKALIFPGEEDFGIVPVEAMAAGRPVIAYGRGGARDTVVDGETGILFHEQTVQSLNEAAERFDHEEGTFDGPSMHRHAARFSKEQFLIQMHRFTNEALLGDMENKLARVAPKKKSRLVIDGGLKSAV